MDWKQLEQDREDGTPGPWEWRLYRDGWSISPGILLTYCTDGTPGGDEIDRANASRIARAPDLEALALAGRELAEAADCTDYIKKALEDGAISDEWAWIFVDIIKEHDAALAAWRKAGGEARMTQAPERIKAWVTRNGVTEWEAGSLQFPPDTEVEYIRADLSDARVAAAYEAVADGLVVLPAASREQEEAIQMCQYHIRALAPEFSPADAQAALDRMIAEAVQEALEAAARHAAQATGDVEVFNSIRALDTDEIVKEEGNG